MRCWYLLGSATADCGVVLVSALALGPVLALALVLVLALALVLAIVRKPVIPWYVRITCRRTATTDWDIISCERPTTAGCVFALSFALALVLGLEGINPLLRPTPLLCVHRPSLVSFTRSAGFGRLPHVHNQRHMRALIEKLGLRVEQLDITWFCLIGGSSGHVQVCVPMRVATAMGNAHD